jgi:Heterokaryon incompatibility protein (HET)
MLIMVFIVCLTRRAIADSIGADDPAVVDPRIIGRDVAAHSGDAESLSRLAQRLRTCETTHQTCLRHDLGVLPTRLLDLGDHSMSRVIRLVEGNSRSGRYAALSYCWGPPSATNRPFKTTVKTLGKRLRGIAYAELPGAIKDAVVVTRSLGIRYLWVDALCIIQDSAEDWASESMKMATVYHNAVITIAASCSPESRQRFLRRRPRGYSSCSLPIRTKFMSTEGTLYLRCLLSTNSMLPSAVVHAHWRQPVQFRAWTLQERLLSFRTAFFDQNQILWECPAGQALESRVLLLTEYWPNAEFAFQDAYNVNQLSMAQRQAGHPGDGTFRIQQTDDVDDGSALTLGNHTSTDSKGAGDWYHIWYNILHEYGIRDLTRREDCLPAIFGIINEFQSKYHDHCLAGLWKNDIRRGLLWRVHAQGDATLLEDKRTVARTDVPAAAHRSDHAPSWSWASMLTDGLILNTSMVNEHHYIPDSHEAQLLSATTTTRPATDPNHQPWPSTLEIRGFSRPVNACPIVPPYGGSDEVGLRVLMLSAHQDFTFSVDEEAVLVQSLYQQSALDPHGSTELQLLCIGLWDSSFGRRANFPPERRVFGLLLMPCLGYDHNVYRRVGLGSLLLPSDEHVRNVEDFQQGRNKWYVVALKRIPVTQSFLFFCSFAFLSFFRSLNLELES